MKRFVHFYVYYEIYMKKKLSVNNMDRCLILENLHFLSIIYPCTKNGLIYLIYGCHERAK